MQSKIAAIWCHRKLVLVLVLVCRAEICARKQETEGQRGAACNNNWRRRVRKERERLCTKEEEQEEQLMTRYYHTFEKL